MGHDSHMRILIAEDDYLSCVKIRELIAQSGFSVVGEAHDGGEAVRLTVALEPDLVLMDIKMTPIGGIEAAHQIQHVRPTPIVILTAYQTQDLIESASEAGVLAYLKKPLTLDELTRTLPIVQARFHDLQVSRWMAGAFQTKLQQCASEKGLFSDMEARITQLVQERTEKLQQSNVQLQAELAMLKERDEVLNVFLEANMNANILVNDQGRIILFNPAAEELFGYTSDEVRHQPIRILLREQAGEAHQTRLQSFLQKGVGRCGHIGQRMEFIFRRKNGTLFEAEMSMVGGRRNGSRFLVASLYDITERKQAQERLNIALEEKEFLIKEAYHRTKNNMLSIVHLLKLQSSRTQDEQIANLCQAIEHRVQAMLLVQQRLYTTDDVRYVDLKPYCEELAYVLWENMCLCPGRITVKCDLTPITVSGDTAIVCGLVLNELMTNALKHAFPDNRAGEIVIRLHALRNHRIELSISDNGIGLPEDVDISAADTLGLKLINLFVRQQLRGDLEIDRHSGTAFRITLPQNLNKTQENRQQGE